MANLEEKANKQTTIGVFWGKGKIIIVVPFIILTGIGFLGWQFWEANSYVVNVEQVVETFVCDNEGRPALNVMLVSEGQVGFPDQFGNIRFKVKSLGKIISVRDIDTKREILVIQIPDNKSLPERIVVNK